jgi:chromate reductase
VLAHGLDLIAARRRALCSYNEIVPNEEYMNNASSERPVEVCAMVGSLRSGSWNRKLLHNALELVPPDMNVHEFTRLGDVPPYNADLDTDPRPEAVQVLKDLLARCEGVLIVTPEYNFGVPGVLKNALDWASRPAATSPLGGKVALLMGAATGMVGTARAQQQLRQNLVFTKTTVLPTPEILVGKAAEKFDQAGKLQDPVAIDLITERLRALGDWIRMFRRLSR